MSKIRFTAISESQSRTPLTIDENGRRSEHFATNVFNEEKMLQFLTKEAYDSVKGAIFSGSKIDRKIADQVAEAMKCWAINMGATHYTHWFQPLTGTTAENMMLFSIYCQMVGLWKNSGVDNWCSKNRMLRAFPMEESEILSRLGVIPLGILLHQHFYMGQHYVYQRFSLRTRERPLIIKHHCSGH